MENAIIILERCANNQECRDYIFKNLYDSKIKCWRNKECDDISSDCMRNKDCYNIRYRYWIYIDRYKRECGDDEKCKILSEIFNN